MVFGSKERKAALKKAIINFFNFAYSTQYQTFIPAGKSGGSTFSEPDYLTRKIIHMQQKVYGHTKGPTRISKDHYKDLFTRHLLSDKYSALETLNCG